MRLRQRKNDRIEEKTRGIGGEEARVLEGVESGGSDVNTRSAVKICDWTDPCVARP